MSKPITAGVDASLLDRPLQETKESELRDLFAGGAKPPSEWMIGMELELFAVHRGDHRPADYPELRRVLESLTAKNGLTLEVEASGAVTGAKGHGAIFSLEPGGQFELATPPHRSMKALRKDVAKWTGAMKAAAATEGLELWALGYQPFEDPKSMPKMPKARYDIMRSYLATRGAWAMDMMHCTGSVQCAVDFSSERNMTDKIRTAMRVSPFLTALTAASPFFRGKPNGLKSRRYQVWLDVDEERSGVWPEMLDDEGLTFARYVARASAVPPFFFVRDGVFASPSERRPFSSWVETGFDGTPITVRDLLDHLTTFFPEIRPKTYVEVRGADCLPPDEAVAVAAFWRGILDDEDARQEVDDRLKGMGYAELRALQPDVARLGLEANSAAGPVAEVALWLMERAEARLLKTRGECSECVEPLLDRARRRRAPADDMLELAARSSIEEALRSCIL